MVLRGEYHQHLKRPPLFFSRLNVLVRGSSCGLLEACCEVQGRADGQVLIAPAVWPSAVLGSTLLRDLQQGRVPIIESLSVQALGSVPWRF